MGCDFYTYVVTVIQFRNAGGHLRSYQEQGESERHYYYPAADSDSDFDELRCAGAEISRALQRMRDEYGERVLFADGEWKCQPAGKERIMAICTERKIPVERLVRVYKVKSGHLR